MPERLPRSRLRLQRQHSVLPRLTFSDTDVNTALEAIKTAATGAINDSELTGTGAVDSCNSAKFKSMPLW